MRLKYVLIFSLVIMSCADKKTNNMKMELMVLSNYGTEERIISDSTSVAEINKTMKEINWYTFNQVILSKDKTNWMEVGGSLNEDGLSARFEENGQQLVINKPPLSVEHMTEILTSYYNEDGKFKKENKFE